MLIQGTVTCLRGSLWTEAVGTWVLLLLLTPSSVASLGASSHSWASRAGMGGGGAAKIRMAE